MTRDGLDVDVLRSKLDAIDRATTTLRSITPMDASGLRSDPVTAAAVERLTCRLVDLAADINTHISSVVLGRAPENHREGFDLMEQARVLTAEIVEKIKPSSGHAQRDRARVHPHQLRHRRGCGSARARHVLGVPEAGRRVRVRPGDPVSIVLGRYPGFGGAPADSHGSPLEVLRAFVVRDLGTRTRPLRERELASPARGGGRLGPCGAPGR